MIKTRKTIVICLVLLLGLMMGSCARNVTNVFPLEQVYLSQSSLTTELNRLHRENPELTGLHIIGFSGVEDIPIRALRIGNPASSRRALIIGQHHGDEVLGIEVAHQIALDLLSDSEISQRILEQFQIWIVPTINPEGWRIVRSGIFQWKRKNNYDSDKNGVFDVRTDGVDLNRNYPVFWEQDKLSNPADPFYKGTAPANQPEVRAIISLAAQNPFELAILYHSSATGLYSEKIYLPAFTRANQAQAEAIERVRELAELYASQITKDYRPGNYEVAQGMSSRVGNARNFLFHTHGTNAFLVEIGGINKAGVSVIHPPRNIMQRNRLQHSRAFLNLLYNMLD